jgi:3-hydroxyisobutyrate dehydrogenase-like beta-hydroxyacid dehydrogenase
MEAIMADFERIGFIGLGNMGGAIALRLLRAGYPMAVLDLDENKMRPLVEQGAETTSSPEELARRSTMVIASLQAEAVEEVACGRNGIIDSENRDLAFVDLSSTAPGLAIRLSRTLRERGIEMLDAPVSGADIGATNGNLTIFVGGKYAAYQRCLPVLQHIGRMVTYLGKNGNGQIAKQINQMMQTMSELAIYEGLLLAEKTGLDLKMFARAASAGCAQTWRLDELVNGVFNCGERKYPLRLRPGRTGKSLEMAKKLGLTLHGAEAAHQVFQDHDWRIVIDFDRSMISSPTKKTPS